MKHIIRSRGGSKERRVLVKSIKIPDLYSLARHLSATGQSKAGNMVQETWHLCHDLLRAVKEAPDTKPTKE